MYHIFWKLLDWKAMDKASIWLVPVPLFYSYKHTISACVNVCVCVCVRAWMCLLALGCGSSLMQQVCRTWGSSWSGDSAWNTSFIFRDMTGTTCCREQVIHIIPNLLASVATDMALMLVLIEELWLFGGVIGLMRVSRCTAHWGRGNRTLPPDASVVKEPIPMVIISPYRNWLFPVFPEVTNC